MTALRAFRALVLACWAACAGGPVLAADGGPTLPSPDAGPWGRLVDVDGHRLHIWCIGQGRPAVVLEAGLGANLLDWLRVQPALAQRTMACSYDRAGYGWSEPGPKPRTIERTTGELRALLAAAGVPTPVVLVGHSFGGLVAIAFAERYREAVSGLVLVDSMHPEQYERFAQAAIDVPTEPNKLVVASAAVLSEGIPEPYKRLAVTLGQEDRARSAAFSEIRNVRGGMAGMLPLEPLDVPVAVLAHGDRDWDGPYPDGRMERVWSQLQSDLASRLGGGDPVTVAHAGHLIQLDNPAAVVEAVTRIVDKARAGLPAGSVTGPGRP